MKILFTISLFFSVQIIFAQNKATKNYNGDSIVNKIGLKKAILYFEKILKTKPNNEEIIRWLGALNIDDNNLTQGELYYNKALKINSKCGACYKNLSIIYAKKNDINKAMDFANKAILIEPTNASIYCVRGKLYENLKKNYEAKSDYNKAIKIDNKNVDAYYFRSMLNLNEGSNASALLDINTAIDLLPTSSILYQHRAEIYYAENKLKDAIKDMTEAIRYDSSNVGIYYNRAALYNEIGDVDNALNDYTLAIKAAPEKYASYNYRANSKYQKEDMDGYCDDLKICYQKLKKINPKDSLKYELEYSIGNFCDTTKISFYYQRGVAFYNLNKFTDAVNIYTKGLQKEPKNAMALSFRANAYMRLFEYEKAIADYEASIKNQDNLIADIKGNQQHTKISKDSMEFFKDEFMASTYNSIAESYFELGNYNEALTKINNAIYLNKDIKNEKERWYNVRGNIYLALGKYADAKKDFDTSILLNSTFSLAYVNRAIALMNEPIKEKIKTISVGGNFTDKIFTPRWTIPTTNNKTNNNVMLAIADCERAIAITPNFGFAYYTRARINKILGIVSFCRDFLRAKDLGVVVENYFLEDCKR